MIFQAVDFIQIIANIVAAILNFLNPIVSPMGEFMVNWMEVVLRFFPQPQDGLIVYVSIAIVIVILGLIINITWPGNKRPGFLKKVDEVEDKVEEKIEETETSVKKKVKKAKKKAKDLEKKADELEELEVETDTLEEELEELEEDIKDIEEDLEETIDEE